jgi:hypothetical protein
MTFSLRNFKRTPKCKFCQGDILFISMGNEGYSAWKCPACPHDVTYSFNQVEMFSHTAHFQTKHGKIAWAFFDFPLPIIQPALYSDIYRVTNAQGHPYPWREGIAIFNFPIEIPIHKLEKKLPTILVFS